MNEDITEAIAHVAHEANRAWQVVIGDPAVSPHWEDAPDWQKASAREGVEAALNGATAEELHMQWVQQKLIDGWTWGPRKDADIKTHPCLVRYEELEPLQRAKDALFHAVVYALA